MNTINVRNVESPPMLRCVQILVVVIDPWEKVGLSNVAEDTGNTATPLSHPFPSAPDSGDVRLSLEACEKPSLNMPKKSKTLCCHSKPARRLSLTIITQY